MVMRSLALLAIAAAFGSGCSCGPTGSGLAINVVFEAGSESKCAIVGVQKEGASGSFDTKAIVRPKDDALVVGVERTSDIRGRLVPFAHGFASADCSGSMIESAISSTPVDLDLPGRKEVTLVLRGRGVDGGRDAGPDDAGRDAGPISDGGCLIADCSDPSCGGHGCNDNDPCTTTDICLWDGGCAGTLLACNTPAQCELVPGTCVGGTCGYSAATGVACNTSGICRSDKSCGDGGEVFCADGMDNDQDTLFDCADPDCANQTCDAGPSTCFLATTCASNACIKTTPIACVSPGPCFVSAGACVEGTGCPFTPLPAGTSCSSASFCAGAGSCGTDGGCQFAPPPRFARCDAGFCRTDGTCGAPFPFPPSNFDPNTLTVPDASVSIDCLAEFDSDIPANGGFASWCGPRPLVFVRTQPGGDEVAVLVMPNLNVTDAGALYLTGLRPVVLAVFGDASVDGKIVAGPRPGSTARGAGGALSFPTKPHCLVAATLGRGGNGVSGNQTSGGGGGGAFGAASSAGGIGAGLTGSGGLVAVANGNAEIVPLRGGCPGGYGGSNVTATNAPGGTGGGAFQLSVAGSLSVSGSLAAPGRGGAGGNSNDDLNAGGGGAGSGGAILLEANALRMIGSATLTAHGGGGGEGDGDPQDLQPGDAGEDGHILNVQVALGGAGGSARGGNGGLGAVWATPSTVGLPGASGGGRNGGGGGGGASVGRIRFNILTACLADAGIISPMFTGTCP